MLVINLSVVELVGGLVFVSFASMVIVFILSLTCFRPSPKPELNLYVGNTTMLYEAEGSEVETPDQPFTIWVRFTTPPTMEMRLP